MAQILANSWELAEIQATSHPADITQFDKSQSQMVSDCSKPTVLGIQSQDIRPSRLFSMDGGRNQYIFICVWPALGSITGSSIGLGKGGKLGSAKCDKCFLDVPGVVNFLPLRLGSH